MYVRSETICSFQSRADNLGHPINQLQHIVLFIQLDEPASGGEYLASVGALQWNEDIEDVAVAVDEDIEI